jgi:hypothetical protein
MNRSGRSVTEASRVIEMEEVLEDQRNYRMLPELPDRKIS